MQEESQQHDNKQTREDFFRKLYTSHFIVRVRKGYSRFYGERELETSQNCNILTPHSYGRQRCVFLVLQGCSTGGSEAHSAGFLYHILSATSLAPNTIRAPRALSAWCGFPYHISSLTPTDLVLSLQSYIIVQLPLNPWNGMFDRHQSEITVMQFTGNSLPVYQSMSVSWDFFTLSHFVSQFPPTRFPIITAIGMCHFLPVHHLRMASLAGSKVKIQHIISTIKWD